LRDHPDQQNTNQPYLSVSMKRFIILSTLLLVLITVKGQVSVNSTGAAPDPKAMLDVSATDKGLLPPRLTTAQRDGISSPIPDGLMIFNTTIGCIEYYLQSQWYSVCGSCPVPSSNPTAAAHSTDPTSITWNWNAVSGATGYKWNTTDHYNSATDVGNALSYEQSGLTCANAYTLYVWAYNACGSTSSTMLTASTDACPWVCGTPLSITHTAGDVAPVTKTVSYGTLSSGIGGTGTKCWITQNLGADNQASSATDVSSSAAGWFWQFNRKQGYAYNGSVTPSWTITSITENSAWLSANDPCLLLLGSGWRIPTLTEWTNAEGAPQNWTGLSSAYASVLKLHGPGILNGPTGEIDSPGAYGAFWSSAQNSDNIGRALTISAGGSDMNFNSKAGGFSLRCVKD
jgi:hypothetical protein